MASTNDNERPNKRTKYDYSESFLAIVGEEKREFVVHKNILCRTSDFFRAATGETWKEAIDKTISLPEVEVAVFDTYLGWVYIGSIEASADFEPSGEADPVINDIYELLISAYALGEYLQDRRFKNAVADEMLRAIEAWDVVPGTYAIDCLMAKVAHTSKFARMVIDYIATELKTDEFENDVELYPQSFVKEIARVCVQERDIPLEDRQPLNRSKCYYHEHRDERDSCEHPTRSGRKWIEKQ